jgi:APA family basic amino acid/polyamine antiporter
MFLVIGSGSLATLAAAFPRYLDVFIPLTPALSRAMSVVMIELVTMLNVHATRRSADVQNAATALKVCVILVLTGVLIYASGFQPGSFRSLAGDWRPGPLSPSGMSGALTAIIGVLWAYEGWQYVTFSAGETVDPQRTFARGIVIGTTFLVGIYELANIGYLRALGAAGVAASNRVASDAASVALGGWAAPLVAAVILVSIFSAANGLMLTLPRLFFAMARDRVFFARLGVVSPPFGTPATAIISTALWSVVLVLSGTFEQLLTYVVFMSWLWFALAALALFASRRRAPEAPRPFRTPGYPFTPVVFVAAALVIVVNTVVAQPRQALVGLAFTVLGVPAYLGWRSRDTSGM